jgi:hypothetical protein
MHIASKVSRFRHAVFLPGPALTDVRSRGILDGADSGMTPPCRGGGHRALTR